MFAKASRLQACVVVSSFAVGGILFRKWVILSSSAAQPWGQSPLQKDKAIVVVRTTRAPTAQAEVITDAQEATVTTKARETLRTSSGQKMFKHYKCEHCVIQELGRSCPECLETGYDQRQSQLLRVTNVFYRLGEGTPYVFTLQLVQDCIPKCPITNHIFKATPEADLDIFELNADRPMIYFKPMPQVNPNCTWQRTALVVDSDYRPSNFYSYVVHALFSTFITAGSIAKHSGCSLQKVEIYSSKYRLQKMEKGSTKFDLLWEAVLGPRQDVTEMSGCYRNVFFGRIANSVWPACTTREWLFDPIISTWWNSFRSSLLQGLSFIRSPATTQSKKVLFVYHTRMPDWLWDVDWECKLTNSVRRVVPIMFDDGMNFVEQIHSAMGAQGIISHVGSGFVHQIWLSPRSLVLQVHFSHHIKSCFDHLGTHLGHSVLVWRWYEKGGFSGTHASRIFQFLKLGHKRALDARVLWACHILRRQPVSNATLNNLSTEHLQSSGELVPEHLQCDVETVIPWPPPEGKQCGSFGSVGSPQFGEAGGFRCQDIAKCQSANTVSSPWKPVKMTFSRAKATKAQWEIFRHYQCDRESSCAAENESYVECLRSGYQQRQSQLLHVSPVYYRLNESKACVHSLAKVKRCHGKCLPISNHMFSPFAVPPEQGPDIDFHALGPSAIACDRNLVQRTAIVVAGDYHPYNFYHYLVDVLFNTFLTAGHVAQHLGCSNHVIEVYGSAYFQERENPGWSQFELFWEALLGPRRGVSEMDGCFAHVFYGRIANSNWPACWNREWLFDHVISAWWNVFRSNLVRSLSQSVSPAQPHKDHILFVYHRRMPDWLWEVDWEWGLPNSNRSVVPFTFEGTLYSQLRVSMGAAGLISHTGSGFMHQIWVASRSILLFVYSSDHKDVHTGRGTPGCETCECIPRSCFDHIGTHLGHSVLIWRWCDKTGFSWSDAMRTLQFLQQGHQKARQADVVWACHLLRSNSTDMQPLRRRCDVETVLPWPPFQQRECGSFGSVGPAQHGNLGTFWCSDLEKSCPAQVRFRVPEWKPMDMIFNISPL